MSTITVSDFKPIKADALRGFADLYFPAGRILHRASIFAKNDTAGGWPPSRQVIGRDGSVVRMADRKGRHGPPTNIPHAATQECGFAQVTDAVPLAFPDPVE